MFVYEERLANAQRDLERELKTMLLDHNLTQAELAQALRVSESSISRAIRGGSNPSDVQTRRKIYNFLAKK